MIQTFLYMLEINKLRQVTINIHLGNHSYCGTTKIQVSRLDHHLL